VVGDVDERAGFVRADLVEQDWGTGGQDHVSVVGHG